MKNIITDNCLYRFGPFLLDPDERCLFKDDVPIKLGTVTFDLLVFLVLNAGHLKSREALIETLWPNTIVVEHGLTSRISALRRALGDEGHTPRYIQTVHGHGYRFISPVETIAREAGTEQPISAPLTGDAMGTEAHDPPPPKHSKRQRGIAILGSASVLLAVGGLLAWHMAIPSPAVPTDAVPAMPSVSSISRHSIAVLPFENLSTDKTNAYFAQGVQDMILTKLADIGRLKVISRTSTEQYKSHPADLRSIARALGVATVLEGSVQKKGKKVLINVQLIDAGSGDHIWAQAYTRTLDDSFGVESGVAEQVAAALKLKLLPAEVKRIRSIPTRNSQAYVLFLKGEYEHNLNSRTGSAAALATAITDYQKAVKQDPRFALAYAKLAIALVTSYYFGFDHKPEQLAAAKSAADQALALAPKLAEAHTAKALWYYYGENDSAEAIKEFKRALALKPQDPMIHLHIGGIYRRHGQWGAALREMSAAAALDPQNIVVLRNLAVTYAALRRYRDAVNIESRAVAINPTNAVDASGLSADYLELGDIDHALAVLNAVPESIKTNPYIVTTRVQALILKHDFSGASKAVAQLHQGGQFKKWFVLGQKANVLWLNGYRNEARKDFVNLASILKTALEENPRSSLLHAFLGMTYVRLGLKKKAVEQGQRAVALLPVHKDALDGPTPLEDLAEIYAQTGAPQKATKILARLLVIPAGVVVSPTLLELDPVWNPIRKDPAFQALLRVHGKAPADSTDYGRTALQSGKDSSPKVSRGS